MFRVPLPENVFAPIAEVSLGKVEKKSRFFSTFIVHPCSFKRFRDPVTIIFSSLLELVSKGQEESMRVREGQIGTRTASDS
jgi:hypothetical protein